MAQPSPAAYSGPQALPFSFRRLALQWAPPLVWMALILIASNDWLSAQETEGWLRRILVALFGPIPAMKLKLLHILARKAGHFFSYAVLAWLSYRSARASLQEATPPNAAWRFRAALYGLGFSLVTASLDEAHQAFTNLRSGTFADVLLDMSGALAALALIWFASKRKLRAAERSQS
ncbi:MAG: VanZ family protein [Terriglobales bacterium]